MNTVLGASITNDVCLIVKVMVIVGLGIYNVFAFIIVRQVTHMIATLKVGFETPIRIFSYLHLLAALGLLIFAITIL